MPKVGQSIVKKKGQVKPAPVSKPPAPKPVNAKTPLTPVKAKTPEPKPEPAATAPQSQAAKPRFCVRFVLLRDGSTVHTPAYPAADKKAALDHIAAYMDRETVKKVEVEFYP